MDEFERKQTVLKDLLQKYQLDVLVLNKVSSFAWATCGAASYVNTASTDGVASLVMTANGHYMSVNNIEASRLIQEEQLAKQGWQLLVNPWFEPARELQYLLKNQRVGADGTLPGALDLSVEISRLRARLLPEEEHRFRQLGKTCAEAMSVVMHSIQPGQTERQIAAKLAEQTELRGVQPIAIMVATDERVFTYRHPLPKEEHLKNYALVILCGRKWGLVCSLSRAVYFGKMSEELRQKMQKAAYVDSMMIHSTYPGQTLGEVFSCTQNAYAEVGYPDEWRLHHQGGSAGYEPREFLALPDSVEAVYEGQAFAWNPTIQGAKSEDTILVGETGNEVLTEIPGWPVLPVQIDGQEYLRPAILEPSG